MQTKISKNPPTLEQQIEAAKEGRSQRWILKKMKDDFGIEISESMFTNKKQGVTPFLEEELAALSEILGTKIG